MTATAQPLIIKTTAGREISLTPVPMDCFPSANPTDWLKFQGSHIPGTSMSRSTTATVQMYMRANRTDALFDGNQNVTVAGDMLAHCMPEAFANSH